MTRALPFTQASITRRIEAARKAGLRITGILPDGTVAVNDGDSPSDGVPPIVAPQHNAPASKWEDREL